MAQDDIKILVEDLRRQRESLEKKEKTLFVGTMDDFGDGAKILKKINYLDGKSAIVIAEVQ